MRAGVWALWSMVLVAMVVPVVAMAAPPVRGADQGKDPDWPCPQRKVKEVSASQVWDGPPLEGAPTGAADSAETKIIAVLASRRVPVEEAVKQAKAYLETVPAGERNGKATALFAGLLSKVNVERATVLDGIVRFQLRQRARAGELEREGSRIAELKARAEADPKAKSELGPAQELFDWNVRVFQERQSNTPIACEIPVMMEARLFEIGREIRALMSN